MATVHILVAGLGNPAPHLLTRHSVGNVLLESLALRLGQRLSSDRGGQSATADCTIHDIPARISLFKPNSYMNLSGPPIARFLKSLGLQPSHLLVLHDSLAQKPCTLAPKAGGSAGGHNGVRSVIAALGTDAFPRLRIGIGAHSGDAAGYVLERLGGAERAFWGERGEGVDLAWRAIENAVKGIHKGGAK